MIQLDWMGNIDVLLDAVPDNAASVRAPSMVRVSQAVKDLTAGSGLTFEDTGEYELKGIPDHQRVYRVVSRQKAGAR